MENILTYLRYRKDIPTSKMAWNEADYVAFSMISYLDYTGLCEDWPLLSEAAVRYRDKYYPQGDLQAHMREKALFEMADSIRYRKVRIGRYLRDIDEIQEKTVYAVTFRLSRFHSIVAFPGTDHSMLSWKENFIYLYRYDAPGLLQCKDYLESAINRSFMKVTVIGHSKGGLQAVYASCRLPAQLRRKIKALYLFDAPGFAYPIETEEGYRELESRMKSFVPEDCVIGNLNHASYGDRQMIRSYETGFAQHECDNWQITATGIARGQAASEFSEKSSKVFNTLVESVPVEDREMVITEMFDVLKNNGITRIDDINNLRFGNALKILLSYPRLSPQTRNLMKTLLKEMKNG